MSDTRQLEEIARDVRDGARVLARSSTAERNDALLCMARMLRERCQLLLAANAMDLEHGHAAGLDPSFLDRLALDEVRVEAMAAGLEEVVALPDPVGRVDSMWTRPNGLQVGRRRFPLGVVGIIYEARPNVTSDAASLCLKSGNGVILKGGSAAINSNRAVYEALRAGLEASSLPEAAVNALGFVDSTDRDSVRELLSLDQYIDVIIPRGGKGLIRFVSDVSSIPVIKHDEGICHVVVDGSADPKMADAIVLNSKTQRTSVCNSMETLLVLDNAVHSHLIRLILALSTAGVKLHLCPRSMEAAETAGLEGDFTVATKEDYATEWLSMEASVRVVADIEDAADHIARYGSRHTESIVTSDYEQAHAFVAAVDSSCVFVNASTRFADGNELGLGAEIGISTTRLHAYGPMGLEELTTTRFIAFGSGQLK